MVFNKTSDGTQLESIAWDGGRIVAEPDGWGGTNLVPYLYSTDHLGSIRAVRNALTGDAVSRSDYEPYGAHTTLSGTPQRYRYNGKEDQSFAGTPYLDYGARQYDPAIGRWMVPDPLAEHYFSVSPYLYCHGDPINRIDPNGLIDWSSILTGVLTAVAGTVATVTGISIAPISPGLSALLIPYGISSFGLGAAKALYGIQSSDSPEEKTKASMFPSSIISGTGMGLSIATGSPVPYQVASGIDYVISVFSFNPEKPLEWALLGYQTLSFVEDSFGTKWNTPSDEEKKENQSSDENAIDTSHLNIDKDSDNKSTKDSSNSSLPKWRYSLDSIGFYYAY